MRTLVQSVCGFFLVFMICATAVAVEEGKNEKGKAAEAKTPASAISIKEMTYSFGQVSQGEVIRHDFQVFNKGDAVLEIKSVKPG